MFDRRFPLADGSIIEQCDGTAWMASLSLNLLDIAVELSHEEPEYADICERFVVDFVQLAIALNNPAGRNYLNWDEEDGFYYDVIKRPDGSVDYLRTRSLSGLVPLLAVQSFDIDTVARLPMLDVSRTLAWFTHERTTPSWMVQNLGIWHNDRVLFTLVPRERLQRICERLFDEEEFLSPTASVPFPRCTSSTPTPTPKAAKARPSPTARPTVRWRCSGATPTGAGRCGCR